MTERCCFTRQAAWFAYTATTATTSELRVPSNQSTHKKARDLNHNKTSCVTIELCQKGGNVLHENSIHGCLEIVYDAQLALVKWLTSRTEQRRLTWTVEPDTTRTTIPGSVSFLFITCPTSISCEGWCLFSARDGHGELFRVIPAPTPEDRSPLLDAVDALFLVINEPSSNTRIH
jgi:hypothetical protein